MLQMRIHTVPVPPIAVSTMATPRRSPAPTSPQLPPSPNKTSPHPSTAPSSPQRAGLARHIIALYLQKNHRYSPTPQHLTPSTKHQAPSTTSTVTLAIRSHSAHINHGSPPAKSPSGEKRERKVYIYIPTVCLPYPSPATTPRHPPPPHTPSSKKSKLNKKP